MDLKARQEEMRLRNEKKNKRRGRPATPQRVYLIDGQSVSAEWYEQELAKCQADPFYAVVMSHRMRSHSIKAEIKVDLRQIRADIKRLDREASAPKHVKIVDYSAAVEELTPKMLAGIYLLYETNRCYIGQSLNVVKRLMDHVYKEKSGLLRPRLMILARFVGNFSFRADLRAEAENRFMVAALQLGLPLINKYISKQLFTDLSVERAKLIEANNLL